MGHCLLERVPVMEKYKSEASSMPISNGKQKKKHSWKHLTNTCATMLFSCIAL